MRLEAYIVNAFAEELAEGNPAGVVLLESIISDGEMRKIAVDFGKSETAFVMRRPAGYSIRWFSPVREMPLCGHATLAASKVLFEKKKNMKEIDFEYSAGRIRVFRRDSEEIGMDFPLDEYERANAKPEYREFFGIDRIIDCVRGKTTGKIVLVAERSFDLHSVKPDYERMRRHVGECRNGIGITKRSMKDGYDFETRYFNPWAGVDEDPVTGSVHTVLANYWKGELGVNSLRAFQDSQRPGALRLNVRDDKVEISGKARIFLRGEILV